MPSVDDFIHRWVPAKNVEDAPTLVLLHGTGGNEDDLLPLGKDIAPGANMLSPRGKVDEFGMNRFFKRFEDGTFDEEDLLVRAAELADFIAAAADAYGFDPKRVWAVGYSNGANVAAAVLLLEPDLLAGAVLLRGTIPFQPEALPLLHKQKVLILGGRNDTMIDQAGTQKLADTLTDAGAKVSMVWQAAGHGLIRDDLDKARAFLGQAWEKGT